MSINLADAAIGRDNNFNLFRLLAAWAVLVSHSFAIVSGDPGNEPLVQWLGVTPASLAVDAFFFTSGFLVTNSLVANAGTGVQGLLRFALARIFRIYPALLVMVLLTIVLLGLFFSPLPLGEFLQHDQTARYLLKNSTLFWGTTGSLPGVFSDLPLRNVINGSLWTLPFEVRMYVALGGLWLMLALLAGHRKRVFQGLIVLIALGALATHLYALLWEGELDQRRRLTFLFFAGAACWLFRSSIRLDTRVFALLAIAVGVSTVDKTAFVLVYHLCLSYLMLWIAYVPGGAIRKYNRLGDFSYGLYIWAFPVQQAMVSLSPGIGPGRHILYSTAITLIFAILSWHLIEKPALRLVRKGVSHERIPLT
jgi:peptidoglycan/LPS O-acetylase OafA/YrhL